MPLDAGSFYEEYHGHKVEHLEQLPEMLREAHRRNSPTCTTSMVYFAGDSSLDNKHWFFSGFKEKRQQLSEPSDFVAPAVNGYEVALNPPNMVQDVCYWVNLECEKKWRESDAQGVRYACINAAVEESSIVQRETGPLLAQDVYIRDTITGDDVLVVDVGGNDVALRPTPGLIANIAWLLYLTPGFCIRQGPALAPGLFYFIHMFRVRLRRYIERLIETRKPKKVIICMLYFLDEQPGGSWADGVLGQLGYDSNPGKLQDVMRMVYSWGVSQISIPGVEVVPLPLYEILDGKDTTDYVSRVEPSVKGGEKMGRAIANCLFS